MWNRLAACLMLVVASACTQIPKAELEAYSEAVGAVRSAAGPLVEHYGVAEREQRLRLMETAPDRRYDGYYPTFEAADVPALSTLPLPPGAAAVDRGLDAVGHYAETLAAIAENRNVEAARGRLHETLDALGGIAPQGSAAAAAARPVAELLVTALRPAVEAGNREQFRSIVIEAHPHVARLLAVLRDFVPTQYSTTTSSLQAALDRDPPPPDRDEIVARINQWHRAYADYAALLDAAQVRLAELRDAAARPRSAPLAQRAATGAAELRAYAEALRLSLAQLRARP